MHPYEVQKEGSMKDLRYAVAAVVVCLVGIANADGVRTIPTGVYNTGVSNGDTPLASGAIDPHYTLVSSPSGSGPAFVVIDGQFPFFPYFPGNPVWLPNS